MLVLTRRDKESVLIGDDVEITVVEARGSRVRLSIRAPREIPIRRGELEAHTSQNSTQRSPSAPLREFLHQTVVR